MTTTQVDRNGTTPSGVAMKPPCRVATTANITLSGTQTIDGVAVVADDRVLVKDQTTGADNGIYIASATAWTRAPDFDGNRDAVTGSMVKITSGSVNGGNIAELTTTGTITIGTTSLAFSMRTGTLGPVAPYAATLLDDTSAAVARTTLDAQQEVSSLTADAAPDLAADYVLTRDTSASADKKVLGYLVGRLIQRNATTYTSYGNTATTIPVDDTIPQNTEGASILGVSITPKLATSILRVKALVNVSGGGALKATAALFNGGAGAVAIGQVDVVSSGDLRQIHIDYEQVAGVTTALTFSVRVGPSTGTLYINGNASNRLFGGVSICTLSVEEITP